MTKDLIVLNGSQKELSNIIGKAGSNKFLKSIASVGGESTVLSDLIPSESMMVNYQTNRTNAMVAAGITAAAVAASLINPFLVLVGLGAAVAYSHDFRRFLTGKSRYAYALRRLAENMGLTYEFIVEISLEHYVDKKVALEQGLFYSTDNGKVKARNSARLYGVKFSNGQIAQVLMYRVFPLRVKQAIHIFKPNPNVKALDSWDSAAQAASDSIQAIRPKAKLFGLKGNTNAK